MLGNDIIDLAYTKVSTNWTRRGWLEKVCTSEEQESIQTSENSFMTAWRIWSMKESAYKIYIQKGHKHTLNPTAFRTKIVNGIDGRVTFENNIISTVTKVNKKYIHTIASDQIKDLLLNHYGFSSSSIELKKKLLNQISKRYTYDLKDLEIRSNNKRVPIIYYADQPLHLSLSMSHHGNYGAYTFTSTHKKRE